MAFFKHNLSLLTLLLPLLPLISLSPLSTNTPSNLLPSLPVSPYIPLLSQHSLPPFCGPLSSFITYACNHTHIHTFI